MDEQPRLVEDTVVTLLDVKAQGEALNPAWGSLQLQKLLDYNINNYPLASGHHHLHLCVSAKSDDNLNY